MVTPEKILVIGANGQIGTELTLALRKIYGDANVIATDIRPANEILSDAGPYFTLDVLNKNQLYYLIQRENIKQVYLLAAFLSATAEKHLKEAWRLNMDSLFHVLDAAIEFGLAKVFWPSSIAAFGPNSPMVNTPQHAVMDPNTVYGISKLAGEGWCEYYHQKKNVDVRSLRYPGLISYKSPPGGGTTDYAVEIFHDAVTANSYESFLSAETRLPMMYMEDAIRGTIELMEAPADQIKIRTSYNFAAINFTPKELGLEISQLKPGFELTYKPDFRQQLADSWPASIDDSAAQNDWNWSPQWDLARMTKDMLENIEKMLKTA